MLSKALKNKLHRHEAYPCGDFSVSALKKSVCLAIIIDEKICRRLYKGEGFGIAGREINY